MYRMVRLYLAIIILVSPMPVGANRPWIAYLFAAATLAVSSLVLLYSGLSRKIASPPIHLYPLLAIAFLWLLYTALQIFSGEYFLPKFGVLDNIKPDALLATYNDAPQWLPLSLIPEASLYHLALGCMYFLFFFLAVYAIKTPRHAINIIYVVLVAATVQISIGAWEYSAKFDWQGIVPLDFLNLYGIFINGTFINRNHFCGYIATAAALAIGLLAESMTRRRKYTNNKFRNLLMSFLDIFYGRNFILVVFTAIAVTIMAVSGSRGAFVALGLAMFIGLLWFQLRPAGGNGHRSYGLFLIVISSIIVVALFDTLLLGRLDELLETGLQDGRLKVWSLTLSAIQSRPITGFGAGSYTDALNIYRDGSLNATLTYDHAHNHYLELAVETGLAGLALLTVFVTLAINIIRKSTAGNRSETANRAATAIIFALLTLLIHAAVEFNLKIPAITILFHILAGTGVAIFRGNSTSAVSSSGRQLKP